MFKENNMHKMPELFSEKNMLPDNLRKQYEKSWAKNFYEDVFCKIVESDFEVLFSDKYSRPNTPVNIYVSLEILKELFGFSDEKLLESFHFDNLFIFALGLNRIGEKTISQRAFYYMRQRVVEYEEKTGINLFEKVFMDIKDDYLKKFEVKQNIKRIDSTLIGSNIRRLNRIKLFIEVLNNFLKSLNENQISKLSDDIKEFKNIETENYVFSMTKEETKIKIKEIAEYLYRVKELFKKNSKIKKYHSYQLLKRVVNEQLNITDKGRKIEIIEAKKVSSSSLQSPYDPDATYRKKGSQAAQGYSVSLAETCNPENEVQIITDVIVEKNNVDDSKILEKNFEQIMGEDTDELVTDGAYLNEDIQKKNIDSNNSKKIITTAIRGKKPNKDKISSTDFEIKNNKIIKCPNGKKPIEQKFCNDKIIAKFSHKSCANCKLNCFIRKNKYKPHVLLLTKKKMLIDIQRQNYNDVEYLKKCKLRPAIEGTMFQLKLQLRNGKSKYRGEIKVKCSSILRTIAINYKRVYSYTNRKAIISFILKIFTCIVSFYEKTEQFVQLYRGKILFKLNFFPNALKNEG